jgi:GDP-L-fucose synthase
MIVRLTGFDGKIIWETDKPNGQPRRGLDVQRAKQYFGWEAKMPFDEGIRRTVKWYQEKHLQITT